MSDGMKFSILEDTLTTYFNTLLEKLERNEEFILEEMMFAATGHKGDVTSPIPRRLMLEGTSGQSKYSYNPYLFESGQDKSWWTFKLDGTISSVEANYSGMRGYETKQDFMVWAEFSEEWEEDPYYAQKTDPYDRHLDRDYAFYQETGADKYASPKDARHKGFVNKGMGEAAGKQIPIALERMYRRLLRLELYR